MTHMDTLNLTQAAAYLGVSRHIITQAIKTGQLPSLQVRQAYRVRQADLDKLFSIRGEDHAEK